jgi:hypothetical protein
MNDIQSCVAEVPGGRGTKHNNRATLSSFKEGERQHVAGDNAKPVNEGGAPL